MGCKLSMKNEQIISESKKCTDAGLQAQAIINGLTSRIIDIQCVPK